MAIEVEFGDRLTHPAHLVEVVYYLGFRLFDVGSVGSKKGLWDPKWDPKNSGCLAGTWWMGEELRVSGRRP